MTGRWIDDRIIDGDIRLFCFAHAGGGGNFYRPWRRPLGPEIAVIPVVLPGREGRLKEAAYTRMEQLIDPLCDALLSYLDRPFALFGHSVGAVVAYEVARRLATWSVHHALLRLFVSARRGPHLPARRSSIYHLPTDEFLDAIERLNGTPSSLFRDRAMRDALLPGLRADFELNDRYAARSEGPLELPISAFVGDRDQLVGADEMRGWGDLTLNEFSLRIFAGDHFYLAEGRADVLAAVRLDVQRDFRRWDRRA